MCLYAQCRGPHRASRLAMLPTTVTVTVTEQAFPSSSFITQAAPHRSQQRPMRWRPSLPVQLSPSTAWGGPPESAFQQKRRQDSARPSQDCSVAREHRKTATKCRRTRHRARAGMRINRDQQQRQFRTNAKARQKVSRNTCSNTVSKLTYMYCLASIAPNASFLAEASFTDAPLNSRVSTTTASTSSRTNGSVLPKHLAKERLTSARLRQIISGGEDDEDNEKDLQQYTEHQEPEERQSSSVARDDLSQADLSIQEALLVEDLLSVLAVRQLPIIGPCAKITYVYPQSVPGQFITVSPDYSPEDEVEQLQGVRYVVSEEIGKLSRFSREFKLILLQMRPSRISSTAFYRSRRTTRELQPFCSSTSTSASV